MTNKIVAIQGNHPSTLKPVTDTSIFLANEIQNKYKIFYFDPKNLSIINKKVLAKGSFIKFNYQNKKFYKIIKNGYGGVVSFQLKNAAKKSIPFYDKIAISKGPNLGTSYSLCCPFVMLAHYNKLEWAEKMGASRWLIRLSIGLESPDDLIKRLDFALD